MGSFHTAYFLKSGRLLNKSDFRLPHVFSFLIPVLTKSADIHFQPRLLSVLPCILHLWHDRDRNRQLPLKHVLLPLHRHIKGTDHRLIRLPWKFFSMYYMGNIQNHSGLVKKRSDIFLLSSFDLTASVLPSWSVPFFPHLNTIQKYRWHNNPYRVSTLYILPKEAVHRQVPLYSLRSVNVRLKNE